MLKFLLPLVFLSIPLFAQEGYATYYTVKSCQKEGTSGVFTASGTRFVESDMTCAMRSRKWGTKWRVTNVSTGKSVVVTLTDFGPGRKATERGVVIDLTPAAYSGIGGSKKAGRLKVRVDQVE